MDRSEDAANRILSELNAIKADGEAHFIEKDVTLMKNVDQVCDEIKAKEKKLNLLFMTPGQMSMKGRNETSEGLDRKFATNYYARLRFTQQLLPLLIAASPSLSRVVSVLGPGDESPAFSFEDMDLKTTFSLQNCLRSVSCPELTSESKGELKACRHSTTMTDFAFEELAKQNPTVSFIHAFPGFVKTGFFKESGMAMRVFGNVATTVLKPWSLSIDESGERHLYLSTSNIYPAADGNGQGVELGGEKVKAGSDGGIGSGAYLIGERGEVRANVKALDELRKKDAGTRIWSFTQDLFEHIRSSGSKASQAE